jgi:hypothetical protein
MTIDNVDEFGRYADDAAARLLADTSFARSERVWTVAEVEARLVEAARGHERFISTAGPSRKMTHWIDWRLYRNVSWFDRNAMAEGIRLKKRLPDRHRGAPTGLEISRMLEALEWPSKYLRAHDNERMVLSIWFWCEARDQPFSRFHQQACQHRKTAYRRLDRAFGVICDGLVHDGVPS